MKKVFLLLAITSTSPLCNVSGFSGLSFGRREKTFDAATNSLFRGRQPEGIVVFANPAPLSKLLEPDVTISTKEVLSHMKTSELWSRLEHVSNKVKASAMSGSHLISVAAVQRQDPDILHLLAEKAGVEMNAPKTWAGLIKSFLTKGGGGFIVISILATCSYRLSLASTMHLGVDDLLAIIATRIFWEAQEWAIHSRWFHGNGNFRAMPLFKSHDRHHDLPYYHVAVESLNMIIVWWAAVLSLSMLSVKVLAVSPSIAATFFAAYQTSAFIYAFLHAILHSKVSMPGPWFKKIKACHIKHHINPGKNLNMGPNRIDRIMKTDSYSTRLSKAGYE